jgi:hypothetical protein
LNNNPLPHAFCTDSTAAPSTTAAPTTSAPNGPTTAPLSSAAPTTAAPTTAAPTTEAPTTAAPTSPGGCEVDTTIAQFGGVCVNGVWVINSSISVTDVVTINTGIKYCIPIFCYCICSDSAVDAFLTAVVVSGNFVGGGLLTFENPTATDTPLVVQGRLAYLCYYLMTNPRLP